MGPKLASYLIATLNGTSLFGRILPGIVADRYGRYNMAVLAALFSGILVLCLEHIESNTTIIVFTSLFGISFDAIVSVAMACIAQITPSPRQIGAYVGLLMFVTSFARLSSPPISGALVMRYGSYNQAGYFEGASILLVTTILFGVRLIGERDFRKPF